METGLRPHGVRPWQPVNGHGCDWNSFRAAKTRLKGELDGLQCFQLRVVSVGRLGLFDLRSHLLHEDQAAEAEPETQQRPDGNITRAEKSRRHGENSMGNTTVSAIVLPW